MEQIICSESRVDYCETISVVLSGFCPIFLLQNWLVTNLKQNASIFTWIFDHTRMYEISCKSIIIYSKVFMVRSILAGVEVFTAVFKLLTLILK